MIINITKAVACGNRIQKVLEVEPSMENGSKECIEEKRTPANAVDFNHVSLTYSGAGAQSLTDIDLHVKTMARELGSRGITVNAIAPGFVDTEMTEVLSEEIRENACKQIILGRFGKPEDIANTAVFLASDKADYITGQVISVDGGMNV